MNKACLLALKLLITQQGGNRHGSNRIKYHALSTALTICTKCSRDTEKEGPALWQGEEEKVL